MGIRGDRPRPKKKAQNLLNHSKWVDYKIFFVDKIHNLQGSLMVRVSCQQNF